MSSPESPRRSSSNQHGLVSPMKRKEEYQKIAPYCCSKYFVPGMMHFGIHLVAFMVIHGVIGVGVNYFRGNSSLPVQQALLSGAVQAGFYFLMTEGASKRNGYSIRYSDSMLTTEKLKWIGINTFLSPLFMYYGIKALLHQEIKVLSTLVFSGVGGLTLCVLELILADYFKPKPGATFS